MTLVEYVKTITVGEEAELVELVAPTATATATATITPIPKKQRGWAAERQ